MIYDIKKLISKKLHGASPLGIFINPHYFARRSLYLGIKKVGSHIKGKTLDVGCGQKPYEHLMASHEYIGMDLEQSGHDHHNSKIDVYYDGKTFPFSNENFDSIVCNQTLEHVFNPDQFLSEINRVLKPGGKFLITVPFVWDEHEQPYDFARYTSFGIKHVLEKSGFEVVLQKKTVKNFSAIFQLMNSYIFKIMSRNIFTKILSLVFIVPLNLMGALLGAILPSNGDLYLDNIVIAKKTTLLLQQKG